MSFHIEGTYWQGTINNGIIEYVSKCITLVPLDIYTHLRHVLQDVVELLDSVEGDYLHHRLSQVGYTSLLPDEELVVNQRHS